MKCQFQDTRRGYACILNNIHIPEIYDRINFNTDGHLEHRTNEDVRSIEFRSSNLAHIPMKLFDTFDNVESILMWGNLGQLNRFRNCGELNYLLIFNSKLKYVEPNVFQPCQNLNELDFTANRIVEFITEGLEQITTLSLSRNELTTIFDLRNLTRLTTLNLEGNKISALTGTEFTGLSQLRFLFLSNNYLNFIPPETFKTSPNLQLIHLANNNLFEIADGTFTSFHDLSVLELDGNQIGRLQTGVFENTSGLISINLMANKISVIERGVFDHLSLLNSLFLKGNVCIDENFWLFGGSVGSVVIPRLEQCLPRVL